MKINCLACGHTVDLDDAYDDYEGQVKCFACRAALEIRTEQGNVKAVRQVNMALHPSAEEVFERVLTPMKEAAREAAVSGLRRIA
jgi:hypothetical protein